MDNLIYNAYSIFFQLLQKVAPEHVNDFEFLLAAYIMSGIMMLLVILGLVRLCVSAGRSVLQIFYRGW